MSIDNHHPLSNLPFNHLDDTFFNAAIYELAQGPLNFNTNRLESLLFNPIEHLTASSFSSRSVDPDPNLFFNPPAREYLVEDEINSRVAAEQYNSSFSLLHLNSRSLLQYTVVAINGYNLIRLDRRSTDHGGVCMYIKNSIKYSVLHDLFDPVLEVLWVKIQPTRLPRGISTIVVGVLYHPPRADNASMLNNLIEKLTSIESQYTNCGAIMLGDFNHLRHVINNLNHIFN